MIIMLLMNTGNVINMLVIAESYNYQ